jgi:hypothetical protein
MFAAAPSFARKRRMSLSNAHRQERLGLSLAKHRAFIRAFEPRISPYRELLS